MFKIYKSIQDKKPELSLEDFQDAACSAQDILSVEHNLHLILVFFQDEEMEEEGQRKLAGIVYRSEVINLLTSLPFLYFEIQVKTVFQTTNTHYCQEPSLFSFCDKLIGYHNTITEIRPVTLKEFYTKLERPLPF